ncbi:response regulator transcription factor [Cohnella thailandensis]|jgi:Response regulators consisting of a CheY-like receiver domain and a winged-helix DNA-binding domain|uniref:Response regulator transcription factor n=1 Tax=Cohnella thailandensis TaxID=557557 RepID=A0A841T0K0_9BACL|nr:response regulator transcription factor [Cohnella thailandensis]MBB6637684.1 response regulator transcription factor [Cohnella thailandensis]MBP1974139.1 DNA-binding response OmpR family regulator [Cohnella thailandensis]
MKSILIVEDEDAIARVLAAYLRKAGYAATVVSDGLEALNVFEASDFSLVLLDVMLPGMDGWELLRAIRDKSACPVIMLTARGDIQDRLLGLNDGADDYMTKPFVPDEVVARVRAALRRRPHWTDGESKRHFGNLMVDFASKSVFLNAAEVPLNPRDLSLLLFLAESPNRIFTREQLIEHVWGADYEGSDRAVDLSIKRLRQSLAHWPAEAGEIRTLRGTGYQLWIGE